MMMFPTATPARVALTCLLMGGLAATPAAQQGSSPRRLGAPSSTTSAQPLPFAVPDSEVVPAAAAGAGGVLFDEALVVPLAMPGATAATWGPDGRLYVGSVGGQITSLAFADDWTVLDSFTIDTLVGTTADSILGLTFDPFDPPGVQRLLVAHSDIQIPNLPKPEVWPYAGYVSVLRGPDWTLQPLVSGLPQSNHDHGVNGLEFDRNGDLYICVGGNTNAGWKSDAMGFVHGTPLSAALVKARTSKGDAFLGTVEYDTGDDQIRGTIANILQPVDVFAWSTGHRNPFDVVFTTSEHIYLTDNGPNLGLGPVLQASGPCLPDWGYGEPSDVDELNLAVYGSYHGHPNCRRGEDDVDEFAYHDTTAPGQPGRFTQALASFPSSTNGLVEYRARTFGDALRGELLAQQFFGPTHRVRLADDGLSVVAASDLLPALSGATDVLTGPGGAVLLVSYAPSQVQIMLPVDGAVRPKAWDIHPWRARASGGARFVIGGVGFGDDVGVVGVRFDGTPAVITSVSDTRIHGIVPSVGAAPRELVDVRVSVAGERTTLDDAFRFLGPRGSEPYGWERKPDLPVPLAEVSTGLLGRTLYVVGDGSPETHALDLQSGTWSTRAPRPFPGGHHAAVTFRKKLFLFGGIGPGAWGTVQIYDSQTDTWTVGPNVPWEAGSLSAVRIGNTAYVCGGIVATDTVTAHASFDLVSETWIEALAPMPAGRNHTAAGTDGERMFVFGGRDGPNLVGNGFDDVQIYDPATDSWTTVADGLSPLPQARGGMGAAVYYRDEFYVFGGETLDGPGATPENTYDRVDIYDPRADTWRVGQPMPTGRHGIAPVYVNGRIDVLGGGDVAGDAKSAAYESYWP